MRLRVLFKSVEKIEVFILPAKQAGWIQATRPGQPSGVSMSISFSKSCTAVEISPAFAPSSGHSRPQAGIHPTGQLSKPMRCWLGSNLYVNSSWDSKSTNTCVGCFLEFVPLCHLHNIVQALEAPLFDLLGLYLFTLPWNSICLYPEPRSERTERLK